jgi:hypothetical protein
MKSELRGEFNQHADEYRSQRWESVSGSKGEAIHAQAYVECSSKVQSHLEAVFETAIQVMLDKPRAEDESN